MSTGPQRLHASRAFPLGMAAPSWPLRLVDAGEPKRPAGYQGKTHGEMSAAEDATRDAHPTVAGCIHCPDWAAEGTAAETRHAAAEHRATAHPDLKRIRRRRDSRGWGGNKDTEQRSEAMVEVEKRRQTTHAIDAPEVTSNRGFMSPPAPAPVLEEETGPDEGAGSGAAEARPLASSLSTDANPFGLERWARGYRWTREAAIVAFRAFVDAHGWTPSALDAREAAPGVLPSTATIARMGGFPALAEAAGVPANVKGVAPARKDSSRERAASQPEPRGHARPGEDGARDDQRPGMGARTPAAAPSTTVLAEVAAERARQEEKCAAKRAEGENWLTCADPRCTDDVRFPVLAEEFGEVAKELNDARAEHREPGPNLRVELLQLAAVAVAWVEALA